MNIKLTRDSVSFTGELGHKHEKTDSRDHIVLR